MLSTRHSDTIYKISKNDGSIIWRLHGHGGERSDFNMGNLNFSRQHDARFREQNETHTIISFLDNAVGADPQPATSKWSRGLLVALREDEMTAEIIASYDHPHEGHSFRRGSYQVLPNRNVLMGTYPRHVQAILVISVRLHFGVCVLTTGRMVRAGAAYRAHSGWKGRHGGCNGRAKVR